MSVDLYLSDDLTNQQLIVLVCIKSIFIKISFTLNVLWSEVTVF